MKSKLETLYQRSSELEKVFYKFISFEPDNQSIRAAISKGLISISLEHCVSVRFLISQGLYTSAISLLRIQFESLVRAMWITYSANDSQVDLMSSELSHEVAKKAQKLPMISKMIEQLSSDAPANAVNPLTEFQQHQYKALNSFLHSGVHAFYRSTRGYPDELLINAIKTTNGLLGISTVLSTVLTGREELVSQVYKTMRGYQDCFIPRNPESMGQ